VNIRTWAWLATGGILLFAVSVQPGFLNLRIAGLILIARGVAGWWLATDPVQRARDLRRLSRRTRSGVTALDAYTADLARYKSSPVSLSELLGREREPEEMRKAS
jgi:hypothetical protein